jgi:short-subunit dehydrogenase
MKSSMKNIIITWNSKWIGKYLFDYLKQENNVLWFSRENWYDLTNIEDIKKIDIEWILDMIILNAWVWEFWKFEDNSIESYENIINLNLLWNIRILKKLEKNLDKNTKIIFIWSIISKKFMKNAAVYQASKFGLRWFAWWLKDEWKKVFLINPKIVETGFHDWKIELDKRFRETKLEDILENINNIIIWIEKRFEIDL